MGRVVLAGIVAGGLAGGLAAIPETIGAGSELRRFFASGSAGVLRLFGFLFGLYGAVGALGGGLLLGALALLSEMTVLGRLGRRGTAQPSARLWHWSTGAAALAGAGVLGLSIYAPARYALHRFHHRQLISALVGVEAAGLFFLSTGVALLVHSVLSRPRPDDGGDRGDETPAAGAAWTVGFAVGILVVAAGVALMLLKLQANPKMTADLRALNLALWTPAVGVAATVVGLAIGRALASLTGARLRGQLALWGLPLLTLALPAAVGAILYAPTLRILDLRPFFVAALLVGGGLVGASLFLRRDRTLPWLLGLLPVVLWASAVSLGRQDGTRKAALSLAPLSAQIVQTVAVVSDFDDDGAAARWSIGGTDCDDFNAGKSPTAFDWPDNGIDENCNGHDATLRESHPPSPPPPPPVVEHPNVLLITIDALRADHMSGYGYARKTTPVLDRLAAEPGGVLFESAWAHAPSTRYSVPAILTGRYPSTIAWGPPHQHWPPAVLPENKLISEMLSGAGYSTAALLSYHYFEPTWGLARGFADYDVHLMTLHSLGGDPAATSGSSARELSDAALGKLPALVGGGKPFFLWVHYYDPHFRYERHPVPPGEPDFGVGETDLYDGEIRYTDAQIGRLFDGLRQTPAWEKTLVVVTADHGEGLGEHGIPPDRRHGYHLYANQTRVPLLLRVPWAAGLKTAPQRVTVPVGHVDIAPTVLHAATGRPPHESEKQLLGQSLFPLLGENAAASASPDGERVVFQEVMYEGPTVRKALVTSQYHLIENLIPDGTTELYDLRSDPEEMRDLASQPSAALDKLRQRLTSWIDDSAVPADFARRVAGNLSTSPLASARSLSARIGNWLELTGVDVKTPTVVRGGTIELAVVLHGVKRVPAGYRLFVHLRSMAGGFVNADHDFLEGLLSPQRLEPGSYVRDVMKIAVPPGFPGGTAHVDIGLFRREGRAEVSGADGVALVQDRAVRVATIEVK